MRRKLRAAKYCDIADAPGKSPVLIVKSVCKEKSEVWRAIAERVEKLDAPGEVGKHGYICGAGD